jgi:MFS family permease
MNANPTGQYAIEPIEEETIRRVAWRLVPLLMIGYFCAYLDRSNVGMAAPTMTVDLKFSNTVFGFGSGLFFLGYFLAEIPSNLALNALGARRWLARILITWGIVSALTAFVWNDWSFYANRVLLGLAEAGFYPGVVLYMTWWFPSHYRTRMMAMFQSASVISLFIGPPVGGLLLHLDGWVGLRGWQWLFIFEALPPVIMCFVTWQLLTDRPHNAKWLRGDQKAWLTQRLAAEQAQREAVRTFSLFETFYNPKVWLLTLAYFGQNMAAYVMVFFLPLIVQGLGTPSDWIGVVSALPFLAAFFAMIFWGWHSDKTGERVWHAAACLLLCAASLAVCVIIGPGHPVVTMIALILSVVGQQSLPPVFWALPSAMLTGTAAAGGIALINSTGALGGLFGPVAYGWVKDLTGSTDLALLCLAAAPAIAAVLVLVVGQDRRLERVPPRP